MKKQCFVSMAFTCGPKRLFQLVRFDPSTFLEFEVVYYTSEQIRDLLSKNEYNFDFGIDNNRLTGEGETIEISEQQYQQYAGVSIPMKTVNHHIYKKLADLVKADALYITRQEVDLLQDGDPFPVTGISSLSSLKVSRSSMRVHISMLDEEGWKTHTLVGNAKGLTLNEFYVLAKKESVQHLNFECTGIVLEREIVVANVVYCLYKFSDGISLYPQFDPEFTLQSPLINYKVFQSELNKTAVDLLDVLIKTLQESIYGPQESIQSEKHEYPETDKSGVFFTSSMKPLSKARKSWLVEYGINQLYSKLSKKEITLEGIGALLRKSSLEYRESRAMLNMLYILEKCRGSNALDTLETCNIARKSLRVSTLFADLELFSMRAFMFMTDFSLPDYQNIHIARGGNAASDTVIRKVGSVVGIE